ncbi:hypothetical protein [Thalassotalea castellviae]|uniref:Uncharacterized protein n=1 Tax=Thalassotalea castellviae TaxID=3075612 RepID=A0ABU2ZZS1_9GAMM|nr:hypothetical protein [Thalassotalea sp. W431]MDT0603426.1 hypothetical protein [Thalassotalea sp. W431]
MKIKLVLLIILMPLTSLCNANDGESYHATNKKFLEIKDVNHQAQAWGICSAVFKITATFFPEQNAQARQLLDFARGAELAVIMTHVSDGLDKDISPERFSALWSFSKQLGDSIPEASLTGIQADMERLGKDGQEQFINKLSASMKICSDNLKAQQSYIELWRELAKSGLLKNPH